VDSSSAVPAFSLLADNGYLFALLRRSGRPMIAYDALVEVVVRQLAIAVGSKITVAQVERHIWAAGPKAVDSRFERVTSNMRRAGWEVHRTVGEESYLIDLRETLRRETPNLTKDQEGEITARLQRHDGWLCAAAGLLASDRAVVALSDSAIVASCLCEIGKSSGHRNWLVGFDGTVPRRALEITKRNLEELGVMSLDADAFDRVFPAMTQTSDSHGGLLPANLKRRS
jgi:hypothetical protein